MGQNDGSVVENSGCSCGGREFNSHHQQSGSQLALTPIPKDMIISSDL